MTTVYQAKRRYCCEVEQKTQEDFSMTVNSGAIMHAVSNFKLSKNVTRVKEVSLTKSDGSNVT